MRSKLLEAYREGYCLEMRSKLLEAYREGLLSGDEV